MTRTISFIIAWAIAAHCRAQLSHQFKFPDAPPPIADANPHLRTEREVLTPTAFKVFRTADLMVVCEDFEPLKPTKLSVGSKMELGMSTKLYIYPEGGARPAQPASEGLSGLPRRGHEGGRSFYYPKSSRFLVPGKPCIVELEIVIFETDIPAQHMWDPGSDKYRVLWQTTFQQKVEEKPKFPDYIQKDLDRWKALASPSPKL